MAYHGCGYVQEMRTFDMTSFLWSQYQKGTISSRSPPRWSLMSSWLHFLISPLSKWKADIGDAVLHVFIVVHIGETFLQDTNQLNYLSPSSVFISFHLFNLHLFLKAVKNFHANCKMNCQNCRLHSHSLQLEAHWLHADDMESALLGWCASLEK